MVQSIPNVASGGSRVRIPQHPLLSFYIFVGAFLLDRWVNVDFILYIISVNQCTNDDNLWAYVFKKLPLYPIFPDTTPIRVEVFTKVILSERTILKTLKLFGFVIRYFLPNPNPKKVWSNKKNWAFFEDAQPNWETSTNQQTRSSYGHMRSYSDHLSWSITITALHDS